MNLLITIPGFAPHGGTRIIVEWANRLSKYHNVTLLTNYDSNDRLGLISSVKVTTDDNMNAYDCAIITSPHFSHLFRYRDLPNRTFAFMQMAENLFNPHDKAWQEKCYRFYHCDYPLFTISDWNRELLETMGRMSKIIATKNGINTDQFPVWKRPEFEQHTILIESPIPTNPTKDHLKIQIEVAKYARLNRMRVVGYGALPYRGNHFHNYVQNPNLSQINELYKEATILVKCTRFDASSTAPIEAMTKGCVVIRSVIAGDDLLHNGYNCIKTAYDLSATINAFKALMSDREMYNALQKGGYETIADLNWDPIIEHIHQRITA